MNLTSNISRKTTRAMTFVVGGTVVALLVVGAALAGTKLAHRTASSPGLGNLPQPGLVALSAFDSQFLANVASQGPGFSPGSVEGIGVKDTVAFYRVDNTAGPDCFAVGPAVHGTHALGSLGCPLNFPSTSDPVLDFTVLHGTPGTADVRVWQSAGFAADDVAAIAFTADDGSLVSRTAVSDNTYAVPNPPGQHVTAVVALDSTGNQIWSKSLN